MKNIITFVEINELKDLIPKKYEFRLILKRIEDNDITESLFSDIKRGVLDHYYSSDRKLILERVGSIEQSFIERLAIYNSSVGVVEDTDTDNINESLEDTDSTDTVDESEPETQEIVTKEPKKRGRKSKTNNN